MLKLKVTLIGIFFVLLLAVAFQNAERVALQFFVWEMTLPLVVLVLGFALLAFLTGFAVGRIGPKIKKSPPK